MHLNNIKNNFNKYKKINSKLILGELENKQFPEITIAIITYKRENLVLKAIESAINQIDINNYEIIVVDNDPLENSLKEKIKEYNFNILYYKNEKNIGMYGNMNRAIELARGKYMTILHDDDWLEANFLKEVFKYKDFLENGNAINFLYKRVDFRKQKSKENLKILRLIYEKVKKLKKIRKYTLNDYFIATRGPGSLGMIYKRENMLRIGGYDLEDEIAADYSFQAKYCYYYGTILIKKYLCNYRIQENESMKKETVLKCIEFNLKFRKFLLENRYIKYNLKELKALSEADKKNIPKFWGYYLKNEYIKYRFIYLKLKVEEIIKNIF